MRTPPLLLGLLLVGCGGGGGGGKKTSMVTFPANTIVYGVANGTDEDFDVRGVSPTGGASTTLVAGVSGSILLFALDPGTSAQYVLAADPSGSGTYGIYLSKSLDLDGATALVAPTYPDVASLAVANGRVVYSATDASGESHLFALPLTGGTPTNFGLSDASAVSPADGDTVAFVAPVGATGPDAVFLRSLAAGASGTVQTLVVDGTNHALPAFSRDGTRLAYWSLGDTNALFVRTLAGGATVAVPGVGSVMPQGEAFSPDGAALAFVGGIGTAGDILTAPADGSAAPATILASDSLLGNYGLYWTNAQGRVIGGMQGLGSASRRRR